MIISFVTPEVLKEINDDKDYMFSLFSWFDNSKNIILNFNSIIEGYERASGINPLWKYDVKVRDLMGLINDDGETAFDAWYVKYLTSDQDAFKQTVDIVRHVYNNDGCVFLLTDYNNDVSVSFVEGFSKFIRDTYGCSVNLNLDPNMMSFVAKDLSAKGVSIFDANMETYIKLFGVCGLKSEHGVDA